MIEDYIRLRRPLFHYADAIRRGELTIGFIGGSISEPESGCRWSDKLADEIILTHPGLKINIENAAKGSTSTVSAAFRAEIDIIGRRCDIVFIETVVNDSYETFDACREGLLRKLLSDGSFDIVLVYTYCPFFLDSFLKGKLPETILDWEYLAEHYGVSSVFSGNYAFDLLNAGFFRCEEWLPDGVHTQQAGSRVYAEPVFRLLSCSEKTALASPEAEELPPPCFEDNWERAYTIPLEMVERIGPWRLMRERKLPTVEQILFTASLKASLRFSFYGRGVVLRRHLDGHSSNYRYRIDDGEWTLNSMKMPEWGKKAHDWIDEEILTSRLEEAKHSFELETEFFEASLGSSFELCTIGIIL